MKSYHLICAVIVGMLGLWSCSGTPSNFQEQSLLDYGIPITILAPDSLDVIRSTIAFQEDITVKGPEDFQLQIFASDAVTSDLSVAIKNHRESVQENPFFHAFVEEFPHGFIYENRIDSSHTSFGFRHVRLMGGKEYVFQEPLIGTFTEDKARELYEAVSFKAQ